MNLKSFIMDKYAKLKVKMNDWLAGAAGFGYQTNSVEVQPGIKNYALATEENFAAVVQLTNKNSK